MSAVVLVTIAAFVAVQLGIGFWVSRRVKSEADYLVGGRRLGVTFAGMSIFATWFAAESILGASAAVRDEGLAGGRADPMGYALALILLGVFMAARLRRTGATTLPEVLRSRYGVHVQRLAALVMIPSTLLWASAQVRGFGEILAALSPLEINGAILVATGVVIAYTAMGGLLGDVYTDVVQGVIILVGVTLMLVLLMGRLGGPADAIGSITAEQLRLVPEGESIWSRLDTWLVPVVGALIVQETVSRVLACRTERIARRAALFGGGLYAVFGAVPVLIGLLGARVTLAGVEGEAFVPALAADLLPMAAYVVFMGALIAAILSTVDSSLLASGAVIAHDIAPGIAPRIGDRGRLITARVVVVVTGLGACAMALASEGIYDLVLMADGFGTAGIAVVGVAAMWLPWGGTWAAAGALSAAVAVSFVLGNFTEFEAPFIASLAAAIAAYVVGGLIDGARAR
jgi:Na+/proline symporter